MSQEILLLFQYFKNTAGGAILLSSIKEIKNSSIFHSCSVNWQQIHLIHPCFFQFLKHSRKKYCSTNKRQATGTEPNFRRYFRRFVKNTGDFSVPLRVDRESIWNYNRFYYPTSPTNAKVGPQKLRCRISNTTMNLHTLYCPKITPCKFFPSSARYQFQFKYLIKRVGKAFSRSTKILLCAGEINRKGETKKPDVECARCFGIENMNGVPEFALLRCIYVNVK